MNKKKITSRVADTVAKRARVERVKSVEKIIAKVVRDVLDHELEERVNKLIEENSTIRDSGVFKK